MTIFENGNPKEILQGLKNFKKATKGTGTTTVTGRIKILRKLLRGGALQELHNLEIHNKGTTNSHIKEIKEGLLTYLFPMNIPINKNRHMFHSMRKPCVLPMKILASHLTDMNNYLPLFS